MSVSRVACQSIKNLSSLANNQVSTAAILKVVPCEHLRFSDSDFNLFLAHSNPSQSVATTVVSHASKCHCRKDKKYLLQYVNFVVMWCCTICNLCHFCVDVMCMMSLPLLASCRWSWLYGISMIYCYTYSHIAFKVPQIHQCRSYL